jgi:protease-4
MVSSLQGKSPAFKTARPGRLPLSTRNVTPKPKKGSGIKGHWWIIILFGAGFIVLVLMLALGLLLAGSKFSAVSLSAQKVAVIPLRGEITLEGCSGGLFAAAECIDVASVKQELRKADDDPSVKAIVLDINSGGGAVVPSRELALAVKDVKKPVVSCIREVGASGAYYVASASDYIIADRDSMVGSIGVIMTTTQYYGLYEKLGLNVTVIKSGSSKDFGSPYRPMTEPEKAEMGSMVEKIYQDFVDDVANNRNMSVDYVKSLADGSIYLGSDAKTLGLIDSLGGIDDAVDKASEMGQIRGRPVVQESPKKPKSILDYLS